MNTQEMQIADSLKLKNQPGYSAQSWINFSQFIASVSAGIWFHNFFAGLCVFSALAMIEGCIKTHTKK
jgi:hypothetical protein